VAPDSSTTAWAGLDPAEPEQARRLRRYRFVRRVVLVLLAVFVLAGALGFLGIRTRTVEAAGGGYTLRVEYAHVARPALAAPWRVTITHPGGFDGPVTLSTTGAYFDLFDENGLSPDPASATAGDDRLILEFDPPPGEVLQINYDGRIGPNVQWGKRATTEVVVDGEPVVDVTYRTWVLP
jgi:hypothetical protein